MPGDVVIRDILVVSTLAGLSYGMVLCLLATGLSIVLGLMGVVIKPVISKAP